jgi:Prephenate dehydrogenase
MHIDLWLRLFLTNKENLAQSIQNLINELTDTKVMIEQLDDKTLTSYLELAKEKRLSFEPKK